MSRGHPHDPALLKAWRGAESALQNPAPQLPERLRWLHRAIAALDLGKRDAAIALAAQARAAGQHDIALILETCATPKDSPALMKLHKEADRGPALPNAIEKFPHYLRALAQLRLGKKPTHIIAQSAIPWSRPMLTALLISMSSQAQDVQLITGLDALLPRAEKVAAAMWLLRLGRGVHLLHDEFLAPLNFSATRYPDLHRASGPLATLHDRVYGREPWVDGHDEVARTLNGLPTPQQQAWLAGMLKRLARDIAAGRPQGLTGLCHAAAHLAARSPVLSVLARQLAALDARLSWLQNPGAPEPEVLGQLWRQHKGALSQAERLVLARAIGVVLVDDDRDPEEALSEELRREVACFLLAHEPNAVVAARYARALDALPPNPLDAVLRAAGASPTRRAFGLGVVATRREEHDAALTHLAALADSPAELEELAESIRSYSEGSTISRAFRRNVAALMERASTDAMVRAVARLGAHVTEIPPSFPPKLARALAGEPKAWIALDIALSARQPQLARELVTQLGRALRKLPPAQATEQAIGVIVDLLEYRAPEVDDEVYAVLEPLTRFALRDGAIPALGVLGGLANNMDPEAFGGMFWILHDPGSFGELTVLSEFLAHNFPLLPPELEAQIGQASAEFAAELYEQALRMGPCTPDVFGERLEERLDGHPVMQALKQLARASVAEMDLSELIRRFSGLGR